MEYTSIGLLWVNNGNRKSVDNGSEVKHKELIDTYILMHFFNKNFLPILLL